MNEAFFAQLERAIAVATRHERELLAYPNVIMVGVGPARRRGTLTGEAAIVVTVRRKLAENELDENARLPRRIEEIPVDVVEQDKPVEAPELIAAQARAREVLERVKDDWLRQPNVTAVAIGYKS